MTFCSTEQAANETKTDVAELRLVLKQGSALDNENQKLLSATNKVMVHLT